MPVDTSRSASPRTALARPGISHPVTVKAVTRELVARFTFSTSATHTRPVANRGPCLMSTRDDAQRLHVPALVYLRFRDRWEDVWRSLVQLVLGTYMVWDARRLRLCETYFAGSSAVGVPPEAQPIAPE